MAATTTLHHQSEYAKRIRPLLPAEAFLPSSDKAVILAINLSILLAGWTIAIHLDQWPRQYLWLFMPIALIMGNSVTTIFFAYHELMHSKDVMDRNLMVVLKILGSSLPLMPPTLWKALHNKEHHNKTNSEDDPDRNYCITQKITWARQVQRLFVPSSDTSTPSMVVGIAIVWLFYTIRNLSSVLLFNRPNVQFVPASFAVRPQERWRIGGEVLLILTLHFSVLNYMKFDPLAILLAYILPLLIGHAGAMFYIFTNHLLNPMTSINDPLANSLSLRMPWWIDLLHLNFSYHVEHHIYPGMNSKYYPLVRAQLLDIYPEQYHVLGPIQAWKLLISTPRNYLDANTLIDWSGKTPVPCPLKSA